MPTELPLLPTVCVGSYAAPSWFIAAQRLMREGQMGDQEVSELFDDAVTICVNDQMEAGVDILSDGEFRRQRFVFELFDALEGLERLPVQRRLGVPGYDKAPRFHRIAQVKAPRGLGTVAEFEALKRRATHKPLKIALPGPLTFAAFIGAEGEAINDLFDELQALVRQEIDALVSAGCNYIQLDEPGLTITPYGLSLDAAASSINDVLAGVPANTAVHVCFGNNAGRPFADRRLSRLMPALKILKCKQLMLEFANREMGEIELLKPLSEQFSVAAGVIDVKNFYVETADDVAERLRRCLGFIAPGKLVVTADCGFSALPRHLARAKMRAMTAGARLMRDKLQ
jgi:5-methyltetrahydropteroyltriglutamate--homocysteine methyltransferase